MNVYLTFDVEIWCNGWIDLDARFPSSFDRYVFGRSSSGAYALPKTLEILNRHGLKGTFFVEPLFSARFGSRYLDEIVDLIREAGQDVELHLHPEWVDEAAQALLPGEIRKRQHLTYYSLEEQVALVGHGKRMLEAAGGNPVKVFRSGNYAANKSTFHALERNGIFLDSSLNATYAISGADLEENWGCQPFAVGRVTAMPITVFRDGFGRRRHAQIGACSAREMCEAFVSAQRLGYEHFVVVSHNFELLREDTSDPDWRVVRRFEEICRFLDTHRESFSAVPFPSEIQTRQSPSEGEERLPSAGKAAVVQRYFEQAMRRI